MSAFIERWFGKNRLSLKKCPDFGEILDATLRHKSASMADNVMRKNALFEWLEEGQECSAVEDGPSTVDDRIGNLVAIAQSAADEVCDFDEHIGDDTMKAAIVAVMKALREPTMIDVLIRDAEIKA